MAPSKAVDYYLSYINDKVISMFNDLGFKDGLMFIHPDIKQLRSITIREAALLQSFPMDFEFLGSNAYCFKMIGNAVPVAFAKQIALAISDVLKRK